MNDKEIKTTEDKSEEVKDVDQTSSETFVRTINDHVAEILNIKKKK